MSRLPGWLLAKPISHRGLHDAASGAIENSMTAIARSVDAGFGIELDVRMSADGVAMVFHDEALDRLTGSTGAMADRTAAELQALPLSGSGDTIPSLAQALALVAGRVPVIVEIKHLTGSVGALEAATLSVLRGYPGSFTVQSFRPETLDWFRRQAPDIVRGQLSCDFERRPAARSLGAGRRAMLRRLMFGYLSQPDYISYDIEDLPYRPAQRLRRRGYPLIGYTAHTRAELTRIEAYIDNIIFEGFRPL